MLWRFLEKFCNVCIFIESARTSEDSVIPEVVANAELDCIGLYCPMPVARTREEIDKIAVGQILKVIADDPAAEEDIQRWAKRTGHEIVRYGKEGMVLTFYIKRTK